ncbi:PilT/PilU family type 4a pilus ATPase [Cellulomonas sp. ATA003]|uniref:type IV pilus twitching motility protein PilT n=1 Tax=Cellulomonas sp. ATA003 TaxID=3073064 RepID=UPI0028738886|nr:PilT/PilU family type 4a pilus ATPase [Cellulomonas sp. ATA003]WNB86394.1 PilT/PilU family type 4a pilus ATPase [Cellulomonas sp. ATA003]
MVGRDRCSALRPAAAARPRGLRWVGPARQGRVGSAGAGGGRPAPSRRPGPDPGGHRPHGRRGAPRRPRRDLRHDARGGLRLLRPGVGRFRVNAYRARGAHALVFRRVAVGAVPLADLGLPDIVGQLALEPRGLVLVTGPTGVGKTTTLASMVDLVNTFREVNIVTIEDPIEVLHQDKKAIVSQREVRQDTLDFTSALRAAMRQDPDVILVGEMRDSETVRAALSAAETGHLVLSTLHTIDAGETVNRIVDFFPPYEQKQIRNALAQSLRGIVSQRLVRRADGTGRRPAVEVMVNTGRTAAAIVDPLDSPPLLSLIRDGGFSGMQTFDQHLLALVRDGEITYAEACAVASNPQDLTVELRGAGLLG